MVTHLVLFKLKAGIARDDPRVVTAIASLTAVRGIIGGYRVGQDYPQYPNALLFCFTETNTKSSVDSLLSELSALSAKRYEGVLALCSPSGELGGPLEGAAR